LNSFKDTPPGQGHIAGLLTRRFGLSILGVVIRTRPRDVAEVTLRLGEQPGLDLALNPGDGRLVVVIEDAPDAEGQPRAAATTLGAIALWTEVLNTSLVYEYSGPDAPAPAGSDGIDYRAWRAGLTA